MAQMIELTAAKAFVMGNYPNDPLLKHIAVTLLDKLPKVDAVEVVHGRWIPAGHHTLFACSVCGDVGDVIETNYCPNCGAKMDGERRTDG